MLREQGRQRLDEASTRFSLGPKVGQEGLRTVEIPCLDRGMDGAPASKTAATITAPTK